jgi:hypothetical protein
MITPSMISGGMRLREPFAALIGFARDGRRRAGGVGELPPTGPC